MSEEGTYAALRVSCEVGQPFGGNYGGAELAILNRLCEVARISLPSELLPPNPLPEAPPGARIALALGEWAIIFPLPLVILFDEIDALTDETLESMLRQLRDGFSYRPHAFPHSVILCGLRDVRDYKIASGGSPRLGTASH